MVWLLGRKLQRINKKPKQENIPTNNEFIAETMAKVSANILKPSKGKEWKLNLQILGTLPID